MRYRDSGVDPEKTARILEGLKRTLEGTHGADVVGGIGGFSGVARAPEGSTFLVATADGVGTKVLLARELGRHASIGRDIVHHCVNDCLCSGAEPLFFLDYVAFDSVEPRILSELIEGLASACREQGIALLGGETAEMPGVYLPGAYDLAGFLVGHARTGDLFRRDAVQPGDAILGLPAAGLHTNGYSLVRKIVRDRGLDLTAHYAGLDAPLAELLMAEHRSYRAAVRGLRARFHVRGLAHITGGGLPGNLGRALPEGIGARLERRAWPASALIDFLARAGDVAPEEALRTWNAGIGLAAVVPPEEAPPALAWLASEGHGGWEIGRVDSGVREIVIA